jgi:hypothetical protein
MGELFCKPNRPVARQQRQQCEPVHYHAPVEISQCTYPASAPNVQTVHQSHQPTRALSQRMEPAEDAPYHQDGKKIVERGQDHQKIDIYPFSNEVRHLIRQAKELGYEIKLTQCSEKAVGSIQYTIFKPVTVEETVNRNGQNENTKSSRKEIHETINLHKSTSGIDHSYFRERDSKVKNALNELIQKHINETSTNQPMSTQIAAYRNELLEIQRKLPFGSNTQQTTRWNETIKDQLHKLDTDKDVGNISKYRETINPLLEWSRRHDTKGMEVLQSPNNPNEYLVELKRENFGDDPHIEVNNGGRVSKVRNTPTTRVFTIDISKTSGPVNVTTLQYENRYDHRGCLVRCQSKGKSVSLIKDMFSEKDVVDVTRGLNDSLRNPPLGDLAKQPPFGDQAKQPSVGDQAKQPSVGDQAKQAQDGDQAKQPSVGDQAKQAQVGDQAKQPSVGDQAKQAQDGDQAKQPSVGDQAKQAQDGDQAKQPSVGDQAKQAQEGAPTQQPPVGDPSQQTQIRNQNQAEILAKLSQQIQVTERSGKNGRKTRIIDISIPKATITSLKEANVPLSQIAEIIKNAPSGNQAELKEELFGENVITAVQNFDFRANGILSPFRSYNARFQSISSLTPNELRDLSEYFVHNNRDFDKEIRTAFRGKPDFASDIFKKMNSGLEPAELREQMLKTLHLQSTGQENVYTRKGYEGSYYIVQTEKDGETPSIFHTSGQTYVNGTWNANRSVALSPAETSQTTPAPPSTSAASTATIPADSSTDASTIPTDQTTTAPTISTDQSTSAPTMSTDPSKVFRIPRLEEINGFIQTAKTVVRTLSDKADEVQNQAEQARKEEEEQIKANFEAKQKFREAFALNDWRNEFASTEQAERQVKAYQREDNSEMLSRVENLVTEYLQRDRKTSFRPGGTIKVAKALMGDDVYESVQEMNRARDYWLQPSRQEYLETLIETPAEQIKETEKWFNRMYPGSNFRDILESFSKEGTFFGVDKSSTYKRLISKLDS